MRYIVAVSGGVDSVVLLDMLVHGNEHELIVAHFDHGIRLESDADERFVARLADSYGLPYESRREELGKGAGEALARERRYAFLRQLADQYDAVIATAHHQDDLVETIAINLVRGTGWRGLAVFDNARVERPLLGMRKTELYSYAVDHGLEWVEDETNATDAYLRNQLRRQLHQLDLTRRQSLVVLRDAQCQLKHQIDDEAARLRNEMTIPFSRYFFTHIDEASGLELLRTVFDGKLTRPQLRRVFLAIKTARAGSVADAGAGRQLVFTSRDFIVKTP